MGHLSSDLLGTTEGHIVAELSKRLGIYIKKETKKVEFIQMWLDIFSTRDICTNCIKILTYWNNELLKAIIEKLQKKFPKKL